MGGLDMAAESPLWSRTAAPFDRGAPLEGELRADVAIVGAGFLGLSTALHLAERGIDVVVIEAEEPGAGASGRNTGFVIPNVQTPNGPDFVVETFGASAGEWLVDKIAGSAEFLFRLVERLGLACEAEQVGWVQAAHSSELAAVLARVSREWKRFGVDAPLLDDHEMEATLGFRRYPAGIKFVTGGQINPLAYLRGLASAARARGVRLYCGSGVEDVARKGTVWQVKSASGASILAQRVLLEANGGLDKLAPDSGDPLRLQHMRQSATFVLAPDAPYRGPLLPFSDTSPHPNLALRRTKDGRLVTGGPPELARERLKSVFPPSQPVDIEFTWGGNTVHTSDLMPRYVELAPGLAKVVGCNGRGVAMATRLGALVAQHIAAPGVSDPITRLNRRAEAA